MGAGAFDKGKVCNPSTVSCLQLGPLREGHHWMPETALRYPGNKFLEFLGTY
jgi:hypothetical protein